jgi:SWI/SNF-related matrix-associated actin-dependent regulator of chromatin subfamily A-like protein 1
MIHHTEIRWWEHQWLLCMGAAVDIPPRGNSPRYIRPYTPIEWHTLSDPTPPQWITVDPDTGHICGSLQTNQVPSVSDHMWVVFTRYDTWKNWCTTHGMVLAEPHVVPEPLWQWVSQFPALQRPIHCPAHLPLERWHILYPYQQQAVHDMMTQKSGRVLLGDEMGLGKTIQTIMLLQALGPAAHPILIVAPTSLLQSWRTSVAKWWPETSFHVFKGARSIKRARVDAAASSSSGQYGLNLQGITWCTYGMFSSEKASSMLHSHAWQTLILDESHAIKNHTAQRSKSLLRMATKTRYIVELTGTPLDKTCDLYAQIHMLAPELAPRFHPGIMHVKRDRTYYFAHRYCIVEKRYVHPRKPPVLQFTRSCRTDELRDILQHTLLIRRLKVDYLDQLPPKIRKHVWLGPLSRHLITEPLKEVAALRAPDVGKALQADSKFMELFRLTGQYKIDLVLAYVREIWCDHLQHQPDDKVIFFTYHHAMTDALRTIFPDAVWMDGRMPMAERPAQILALQNQPQTQVGIFSIQTTGAGVDFPQVNHVVFTELAFSPALMLQSEDRIHRIGQVRQSHIHYLLLQESTDDVIMMILDKKLRTAHAVLQENAHTALQQLHPYHHRPSISEEPGDSVDFLL